MWPFTRRFWFELRTLDGEVLTGKQEKGGDLSLLIETSWHTTRINITKVQATQLAQWLVRAYQPENPSGGGKLLQFTRRR